MFTFCVAAVALMAMCGLILKAKTKTNWFTYEVRGNNSASPYKRVRLPPSKYG